MAFILSVVFSIGGVGSAIAIVPVMGWPRTHLMHFRMSSDQLKKVLGAMMYLIALKTLLVALSL